MALTPAALKRQQIKNVRDSLINGTEIIASQFHIVQLRLRTETVYAIECHEIETLQKLTLIAHNNYDVQKASNIVIMLWPKSPEAKVENLGGLV